MKIFYCRMTPVRLLPQLDIREGVTARNLVASKNTVNAIRSFPHLSVFLLFFLASDKNLVVSLKGGVGCSINCRCEGCKNAFGRKDGEFGLSF